MHISLRLVNVADFVRITDGFKSDINIRSVAKAIMSVFGLDLRNKLHIEINSNDADEVERFYREMEKYIANE